MDLVPRSQPLVAVAVECRVEVLQADLVGLGAFCGRGGSRRLRSCDLMVRSGGVWPWERHRSGLRRIPPLAFASSHPLTKCVVFFYDRFIALQVAARPPLFRTFLRVQLAFSLLWDCCWPLHVQRRACLSFRFCSMVANLREHFVHTTSVRRFRSL